MLASDGLLIEQEYRSGGDALVRRLMGTTRDRDAAMDLAHEAYLRLTREVDAGRTPANPTAWLIRVGLNLAFSRGRHLSVVGRHATAMLRTQSVQSLAAPDQVVLQAELGRALRHGLEELAPVERRAVLLAAEGYLPSEIAPLIGRTPAATRTLICRARTKLRAKLVDA